MFTPIMRTFGIPKNARMPRIDSLRINTSVLVMADAMIESVKAEIDKGQNRSKYDLDPELTRVVVQVLKYERALLLKRICGESLKRFERRSLRGLVSMLRSFHKQGILPMYLKLRD